MKDTKEIKKLIIGLVNGMEEGDKRFLQHIYDLLRYHKNSNEESR